MSRALFNIAFFNFDGVTRQALDSIVPYSNTEKLRLMEVVKQVDGNETNFERIMDNEGNSTGYFGSWSNRDSAMRDVSDLELGILFCVNIEDEDSGEQTEVWYYRGKMQICEEIREFEPFDLAKME